MTTDLDLFLRQGDTAALAFELSTTSPPPITLAGGDIARLEIAWYDQGELVKVSGEAGLTVNVGGNRIDLMMTPAETSRLPAGRLARYELVVTQAIGGAVTTVYAGWMDVAERVRPA